MVKRKGIGYTLEAIVALMTLFMFALGNTPAEPSQNWADFQKKTSAKDLGHTLKKTGDLESFLKRRETGSLKTAVQSISSGQLQVSGTIENLPIKEAVIGVHAKPSDIYNVDLRDRQTCTGDLEEIETSEDILETENYNSPRIYVADTDPDIAGGNDGTLDYDTIYVDRGSKCQFSSDEGPIYLEEFFRWNDGPSPEHYDFKNITDSNNDLLLYDADRAVNLRDTMESEVAGVRTSQSFNSFKLSESDLSNYNLLIFDGNNALNQINASQPKLERFMKQNPVMLLMDLESDDFESGFISDTGLEWIDMDHEVSPADSVRFTDTAPSREVETYFEGMEGSSSGVEIGTGGKVSSSNSETVIDNEKFVVGDTGIYNGSEWNSTNYSMTPADPANFEGVPESACVEDGEIDSNFTAGEFDFPTYHGYMGGIGPETTYNVINTELGRSTDFCRDRDARALNIDLDGDGDFSGEEEGPYLNGEVLTVENKSYKVFFPDTSALRDGDVAEFIYIGASPVEKINIRMNLRNQNIDKLARIPYRNSYSQDGKKLIAATAYHLVGDTKRIDTENPTSISTSVYGGFRDGTYLPYKASLGWE